VLATPWGWLLLSVRGAWHMRQLSRGRDCKYVVVTWDIKSQSITWYCTSSQLRTQPKHKHGKIMGTWTNFIYITPVFLITKTNFGCAENQLDQTKADLGANLILWKAHSDTIPSQVQPKSTESFMVLTINQYSPKTSTAQLNKTSSDWNRSTCCKQ